MKTTQVINRLFWVLRSEYGSQFVMVFPNKAAIDEGKATWLPKLKRYSAENIGKTLEHVKEIHPVKPPDVDQFVKLLKHLKGHRPGHLSNTYWKSRTMKRTTLCVGQERLREIREEYGL